MGKKNLMGGNASCYVKLLVELNKSATFAFCMERLEDNDIIEYELLDEEDGSVMMAADNPWKGMARHINNALKEGELEENSNMHFLHNTQYKYRPTKIYDLDTIICVGYRVHSKRGTAFRIWARKIIKDYLVKGYAVNERIRKEQLGELRQLVQVASRVHKVPGTLCKAPVPEHIKRSGLVSRTLSLLSY